MSDITNRLKEEMKKQGLSEQKLADKAGLSQNMVHRIVSGKAKKIDVQALSKLSWALGLLGDTAAPYSGPGSHLVLLGSDKTSETDAQDIIPDPSRMTFEQKLKWVGLGTKDIRQMQEWKKLDDEEQDDVLINLTTINIKKGR